MTPDGSSQPARSRGYVDYERHAAQYHRGRSLSADLLDRWAVVVHDYLPASQGRLRVADVGAGSGIFAEAWPSWTDAAVLAVEPSAAMVGEAIRRPRRASFLRAVAESLPLRDESVDVVWLSTALHHFADPDRALDELRRTLRPGGRMLIRTFVPGRTEITYLAAFSGQSKWLTRFPDEGRLRELLEPHRFSPVDARDVLEGTETYGQSADWVSRMRKVDSILTALNDDEIAVGLDRLLDEPDTVGRLELTLLVFERG